jgi:hypothetical protein
MEAANKEFTQAWESFRSLLNPNEIDQMQPSGPAAIYTPLLTVWMLVYQRLHAGCSLSDAVSELVQSNPEFLPDKRRVRERTLSANTGAYSRARKRLSVELAISLADHVYQSLVSATPPSLNGRRAFILDGTTITLAPVQKLKEAFPPTINQHGQSAWPVLHMLVAHELESGCAILPELGPMYGEEAVSELELTRRLLPRLPQNSILIGDRNFGVFAIAYSATQQGHDVLLRMKEPNFQSLVRRATLVSSNESQKHWRLNWTPSRHDLKAHPELTSSATVPVELHEIMISATLTLHLVTTLESPVQELAELYRRRQDIETDIRDVKVTMCIEEQCAQSVEMLRKELATSMIAYNLVIQIRRLAARQVKVPARRLSFAGTWSAVKIVLLSPQNWTAQEWQRRFQLTLRMAGQRKIPNRPGRSYPRAAHTRTKKWTDGNKKSNPKNPM